MKSIHVIFSSLLILYTVFIFQPVKAEPVALQIAFKDGGAIRDTDIAATEALLKEKGFKTITIQAYTPISYLFSTRKARQLARESVIKQIKELKLDSEDQIQILLINTHGNSIEAETELSLLGKINEIGVNTEFNDVFNPIRNQTAKDLRVILSSCTTFCGTENSTFKRARNLLKYFNAPEGAIFGANTKVSSTTPESFRPTASELKLYFTVVYPIGFMVNFFTFVFQKANMNLSGPVEIFSYLFGMPALLIVSLYSIKKSGIGHWFIERLSDLKLMNHGNLYSVKEGVVQSIPMSLTNDMNSIIGSSCEKLFLE